MEKIRKSEEEASRCQEEEEDRPVHQTTRKEEVEGCSSAHRVLSPAIPSDILPPTTHDSRAPFVASVEQVPPSATPSSHSSPLNAHLCSPQP